MENKDVFIDVKKNKNGPYLKISERNGKFRKSIILAASGIGPLQAALQQAQFAIRPGVSVSPPVM